MLKSFENIDNDDIEYLIDIVFSFSESRFEGKIVDYNPNKYFSYRITRNTFKVSFLWTLDYRGDQDDLLHGLYLYKDKFSKITGTKIHHVLFDGSFVMLTFYETNSDLCKFSKKFMRSSFSDNPEVKSILDKRLKESNNYSDYYRDQLTDGIMYRDGGSSNLSLFDWKYQDHKSKTF